MLKLNWISSACIAQAGQAGPLYVNTTISMHVAFGVKLVRQQRLTAVTLSTYDLRILDSDLEIGVRCATFISSL